MAMKENYKTKKKEITSTTIRTKKYENSTCNKLNSPLAFAACTASHRTGAGYYRRVDSRAGPRNARVWYYKHQPFVPCVSRLLSGWLAGLDV